MRYYLKTTSFIRKFFPSNLIWDIPNTGKIIYLTFDDGPTPEVTDKVLDILREYNAKATFFCIGKNVEDHPDLYQKILNEGHSVGNHTNNHFKGIRHSDDRYFENISKAAKVINSKLFRPPYGRVKRRQIKTISKDYCIIMWSVLTADFNPNVSKETCLKTAVRYTKAGSIVVFHDSIKASEKILYALPKILRFFSVKGYQFNSIKPELFK